MNMTRISFIDYREPAAAAAYDIALDYIEGCGYAQDHYGISTFVSQEISKLVDRGEHHKIRLANLAIASFERRYSVHRLGREGVRLAAS